MYRDMERNLPIGRSHYWRPGEARQRRHPPTETPAFPDLCELESLKRTDPG